MSTHHQNQPFEFVGDDGRPAYAPNGYKVVTESHPKPVVLRAVLYLAGLVPVPWTIWAMEQLSEQELDGMGAGILFVLGIAGTISWVLFTLANAPDRVQRAVPAQIVPTPPTRTYSSTPATSDEEPTR